MYEREMYSKYELFLSGVLHKYQQKAFEKI